MPTMLVDVRYRDRELSCSQNNRMIDRMIDRMTERPIALLRQRWRVIKQK